MRHVLRQLIPMVLGTLALCGNTATARPDDEDVVVIKAGRIITAAGDDITQGEIVIVDGKVRLVGRKLEYPKSAKIIDAPRETVMPGLINVRTRADLPNLQRSGVRGDLKVSDEVYIDEMDFEPYLRAGFTTVCLYAGGTGMPGMPAVYRTAGASEDRLIAAPGYLRFTMNSHPRDKQTLRDALKKAKAEIEKVEKAKQEWETKKKEADAKKAAEQAKPPEPTTPAPAPTPAPPVPQPTPPAPAPQPKADLPPTPAPGGTSPKPADAKPAETGEFKAPDIDPTHRPIVDLLQKKEGSPELFLELSKSSDLLHTEDVLTDWKDLHPMYMLGGFPGQADYNYIIESLAKSKPLIVTAPQLHRLPQSVSRFNAVGELLFAGCEVAFMPLSDQPAEFEAYRGKVAELTRTGVERVAAIKGLTLNPAKVIGLDKRLGSIEKGKDADLVFLDGDAMDPKSRVTRVMILGKVVWNAEEKK